MSERIGAATLAAREAGWMWVELDVPYASDLIALKGVTAFEPALRLIQQELGCSAARATVIVETVGIKQPEETRHD